MDKFLTIPDVAEILNVSVLQVRSLLRSGDLKAIQIGGRGQWRIQMSVLEEYVKHGYERTRERVNSGWERR
ncbi:MAG: helix-turn-helix domain-containing protein [Peptidiphaga sp.]|jgi:hypothetical protein|uniref:helix-turn-helix domain-containing protein n=1 Tax=Actinobaculum sp. oral taxon 183 TaxID=712888 RepID=UPI000397ECC0|nr:helix-turn-helix domain-containing protein [Actinobaculum sp. oral taxon 183]ERH16920.1 DNA binding domain, excisionase family [Actinobaculum sp. oral taxon 183 str. F0552]RKV69338.1 MAG: DNA-binding protein [Actinomyces sp.]